MTKHWRLAAAALLIAGVFIGLNYHAYDGFFQDDELDNLSWAPFVQPVYYLKLLVTPLFDLANFRPVGHAYFRLMGDAFGWSFPPYITPLFGFHLLNGMLIYILGRKLGAEKWQTVIAAAFFTLSGAALDAYWKPMYVFDLFCCTFSLLCVIFYQSRRWALSFLCFWLAYKSKELGVMLPAVLVVYEYWLGEKRFVRLIPFLLVSLSFGLQGILRNPNHHNEYSFHFNVEALQKTIPFYTDRVFLFPFSGLCLFLLAFLRDKRVWFALAGMVLVSVPLLFLPGRLYEAYLYLPLALGSVALAAGLSRVKPHWALLALVVWLPFNIRQVRAESREKLRLDDEAYAFVETMVRWAAKHPDLKTFVYSGVPTGYHHWGVTGAWNLAHETTGLKALYFDWPDAQKAHPRAFGTWDGKRLVIREEP